MFRVSTVITGIPGGSYFHRFYFDDSTNTAQQAATATVTWWSAVDNLFANDLVWTVQPVVEVVDVTTGQITSTVSVTGGTGVGADATSYLPAATQILVRWRTTNFVNGREIRGRTFIPGATEAATADGVLDSTWVSTLNTANAALIASANAELVVYSPTHHTLGNVTAASVWTQFAVLRSRRD